MTENGVFKEELIMRKFTTWAFDERLVTPIEGTNRFYAVSDEVESAFYELGYKISVHERAIWKNDDKGRFTQVGTVKEVNLWRHSTIEDEENITLVHGEKVVIDDYANVYKLEDQGL